jgi:polypeptide N-acetylgalactosaminyltransferase
MCGGVLLTHPCSHVGHIYRKLSPYSFPGGASRIVRKNNRRVIDVWTDEFKNYFHRTLPNLDKIDPGNLTSRLELRRQLKCKSFRWYLENVFPEAEIPFDAVHAGEISNPESNLCLQMLKSRTYPGAGYCNSSTELIYMNLLFSKFV